jgi:hypothetical protein
MAVKYKKKRELERARKQTPVGLMYYLMKPAAKKPAEKVGLMHYIMKPTVKSKATAIKKRVKKPIKR